jgi:hypothetical protein
MAECTGWTPRNSQIPESNYTECPRKSIFFLNLLLSNSIKPQGGVLFTVWQINSERFIHARCCTEPTRMYAYSKHMEISWGQSAVPLRMACVQQTAAMCVVEGRNKFSVVTSVQRKFWTSTVLLHSVTTKTDAMRQAFIRGDSDKGPGLFPLLTLPTSLNCSTHRRMLSGREGFALICSEIPLNTLFLPPTTHTRRLPVAARHF